MGGDSRVSKAVMELDIWRASSATTNEILSVSDAARNSLVNSLYAVNLVAHNVQTQIHKQDAMTGANTLMNDLTSTIKVRGEKFHLIIDVMNDVEQLKEVAKDMKERILHGISEIYRDSTRGGINIKASRWLGTHACILTSWLLYWL